MFSIVKATENDIQLLADIGKQSFMESHGSSATEETIDQYVKEKYTGAIFHLELNDPKNIYHIIYHNNEAAGFSKIILNCPHADLSIDNLTKLERLYLLKEFYSLKLGAELFKFNLELSKTNNQAGMWLFVWKENHRAVKFYKKAGFEIAGSYNFQLTPTHSNPNYLMLLKY